MAAADHQDQPVLRDLAALEAGQIYLALDDCEFRRPGQHRVGSALGIADGQPDIDARKPLVIADQPGRQPVARHRLAGMDAQDA